MVKRKARVIYKDLGFPIELLNVPEREILGHKVLDINLNKLQLKVLKLLTLKETALTGDELSFIRAYFKLNAKQFDKIVGWKEGTAVIPAVDLYVRMFILDKLSAKDVEFGKVYRKIFLKLKKNRKMLSIKL